MATLLLIVRDPLLAQPLDARARTHISPGGCAKKRQVNTRIRYLIPYSCSMPNRKLATPIIRQPIMSDSRMI